MFIFAQNTTQKIVSLNQMKIFFPKHSVKECAKFLIAPKNSYYRAYSLFANHSIIEYCYTNNQEDLLMRISLACPNQEKDKLLYFEQTYSFKTNGNPLWKILDKCQDDVLKEGKSAFKNIFDFPIPDEVQFKLVQREYLGREFSSQ